MSVTGGPLSAARKPPQVLRVGSFRVSDPPASRDRAVTPASCPPSRKACVRRRAFPATSPDQAAADRSTPPLVPKVPRLLNHVLVGIDTRRIKRMEIHAQRRIPDVSPNPLVVGLLSTGGRVRDAGDRPALPGRSHSCSDSALSSVPAQGARDLTGFGLCLQPPQRRAQLRAAAMVEFEVKRDPDRSNIEIARAIRSSVDAVMNAPAAAGACGAGAVATPIAAPAYSASAWSRRLNWTSLPETSASRSLS